jgi:hypothetical protein
MTNKLPRVNAADAVRVLEKAGFFLARQSRKPQDLQKCIRKKGNCTISFWKRASPQDLEEHFERCRSDR